MVYTIPCHSIYQRYHGVFCAVLLDAEPASKDAQDLRGERCRGEALGALRSKMEQHKHHGQENKRRVG